MVPDQGIMFDRHNHPRDTRLGQPLRREEPAPISGRSWDERVNPPWIDSDREVMLEDRLVNRQEVVVEEMMIEDHHSLEMRKTTGVKRRLTKKKLWRCQRPEEEWRQKERA
jgi:hypothetical protein